MKYLNKEIDIFSSPAFLETFINNFPIIIDSMKNVLEEENSRRMKIQPYLPTDVSSIFRNMVRLRFEFDKASRKTAPVRVSPDAGFVSPLADFFPNHPTHTMENAYNADKKTDIF